MESTAAHPLQWPTGYKRTETFLRRRAKFKNDTLAKARDDLINQIRMIGGSYPVISTNVPLRRDGLPYAGMGNPEDPGCAIYFLHKGIQRVLACDKWDRVEHNIHAVNLALEAMRGLDRWGVSQMLERMFEGFTALPAPQDEKPSWREIMSFRATEKVFLEDLVKRFRELSKFRHPDAPTGSHRDMTELNEAYAAAKREFDL